MRSKRLCLWGYMVDPMLAVMSQYTIRSPLTFQAFRRGHHDLASISELGCSPHCSSCHVVPAHWGAQWLLTTESPQAAIFCHLLHLWWFHLILRSSVELSRALRSPDRGQEVAKRECFSILSRQIKTTILPYWGRGQGPEVCSS